MAAVLTAVLLIVIYVRVSTEQQAKKGFSLPEQLELCRRKAQELIREYEQETGQKVDARIVEFIDDFGGDILERPTLEEMRAFIREHKPQYLLCLDPDRFSRSLKLQLIVADEIESHGTKIVFVQMDYDPEDMNSRAFFQFRGIMAELEKAKIIERMTRGKRGKLKLGKRANSACPYGYRVNKETKELEIFEPEAKWVREAFRWVVEENFSPYQVAQRLNELGVPTKRGGAKWYVSVVREMLRNTTYIGKQRCNRKDTRGLNAVSRLPRSKRKPLTAKLRPKSEWIIIPAPPIIDEETFNLAQEKIKATSARGGRRNTGLLSMLCRCGVCGGPMTYARPRWTVYLRCNRKYARHHYSPGTPDCPSPHHHAAPIEEGVWNKLCEWLLDPALLEKYLASRTGNDAQQAAVATLKERIAMLEDQLSSVMQKQVVIVEKQAKGLLTEAVADKLLAEAVAQAQNIEKALAEHRTELERLTAAEESVEASKRRFEEIANAVAATREELARALAKMKPELRRELVLKLVKRVTINADGSWYMEVY